jgi:ligand-binding SRPBCC domain-containing protein
LKIYHLHQEQYIPTTIEKAWKFFSLASNLDRITPPGLKFKTLTELTGNSLYDGMKIRYKLTPLMNITVTWETGIAAVREPHTFTDKQLKGPYVLWEHTHNFFPAEGGVKMVDEVRYALPLGWLGRLAHWITVRKKLDDIFAFRRAAIINIFGESQS